MQNIEAFQNQSPHIGQDVFIHSSASIIGDVHINQDSSIWPGTVIRGDVNFIHIGVGTNVQDLSMLHVSHKSNSQPDGSPLIIGDHVTIGHQALLHGCTIEDECLIGMGCIVMDKVVVQKHVMLAAGSLVPEGKVLESGYLYLGRPAKRIRLLTEDEIAHFMYSANHYITLKNQYQA